MTTLHEYCDMCSKPTDFSEFASAEEWRDNWICLVTGYYCEPYREEFCPKTHKAALKCPSCDSTDVYARRDEAAMGNFWCFDCYKLWEDADDA